MTTLTWLFFALSFLLGVFITYWLMRKVHYAKVKRILRLTKPINSGDKHWLRVVRKYTPNEFHG